jgi:alkanesulfonate monooxygenase SsuD/methylene tetrahydromethanopterin reductase-like flavin-dependent oxidoreductase (luciferase family)
MHIGASIFFTEYSISPTQLGTALEERGFDSLWVAEHSRVPARARPLGEIDPAAPIERRPKYA